MQNQFSRSELLIGKQGIDILNKSTVAIFGIGGVGGYTVEALARSGIGSFFLVDNDTVNLTNINRQIIATHNTIGRYKVDVMKERILEINPNAEVNVSKCFFLPENVKEFAFSDYDYIVDAIDTVTGKIELVLQANRAGIPIISCMGAGNKLDPTRFEVTDIYKTTVCPLAKVMRKELKARKMKALKVVYSTETAMKPLAYESTTGEKEVTERKCLIPGSMSFVPSTAGLIAAGEVVKDLIKNCHINIL